MQFVETHKQAKRFWSKFPQNNIIHAILI